MALPVDRSEPDAGKPGFVGENRPGVEDLESSGRSGTPLFFSRYVQREPDLGLITPTPLADRPMISVELRARGTTDMFQAEKHVLRPAIKPGALTMFDLRQSWSADVKDPFDNVNFFIPFGSFHDLADEQRSRLHEFSCNLEDHVNDTVMLNLAKMMVLILSKPHHEIDPLMLDCLFETCREYLFSTHGVVSYSGKVAGASLSAGDASHLLDFIDAHLEHGVRLPELAAECQLSISSLVRAFRGTFRSSPHQWVTKRRIAKARQLLKLGNMPLSEVALACGFVDQSHLTRVFRAKVGMSPGRWRNTARN